MSSRRTPRKAAAKAHAFDQMLRNQHQRIIKGHEPWMERNAEMLVQEAELAKGLRQIAAHDASGVHFETLYRTAYKMVLHKRGDVAREMVLDILRKLSLVQSREKFTLATRLFKSVFDYSERVWVPKAKVPMLNVAAAALYERPVAARWRRVRRAVKWVAIASLTLRELHERVASKE